MNVKKLVSLCLLAGVSGSLPLQAQLTTVYWDAPGAGGPYGGTANWNLTQAKWWNGTSDVLWSSAYRAVFAGTNGTVTIPATPGTITADSIQFDTAGYTITGAGARRLIVTSGQIIVNADAIISVNITNAPTDITTGITKLGAGKLTLPSNNSFFGGLKVLAGTLALPDKQPIGGSGQSLTVDGGTLELTTVQVISGRTFFIGDNHATINVVGAGDAWTFQDLQGGNGTLTKTGAGTLSFTGTIVSTRTGATIINDGTLSAGNTVGTAIGTGPVTVNANGTLAGKGIVGGAVTIIGAISPGTSPGTLTLQSDLNLTSTAQLNFDLDTPGVVGGSVNDWIDIAGDLTLDGTVNITGLASFGAGTYQLMSYGGNLVDNGLLLGTLSGTADNSFDYDFLAGDGKVNLIVTLVPEPSSLALTAFGAILACLALRRQRAPS
jgi:fibronectin-binding autotransporter adhesin